MSNGSKNGEAVTAFLLGLLGGAIGAYLLKKILEDVPVPCPGCGELLHGEVDRCPYCSVELEWE